MKKIKNTELNEKDCLLQSSKSDKIKKIKHEKSKKFKNSVGKSADVKGHTELSGDSTVKSRKKNKTKPALEEEKSLKGEQQEAKVQKKQKKITEKQSNVQNEASNKEVTEAELKKIQRKKEKKLAQKLKKKEKKTQNKDIKKSSDAIADSQVKKKVFKENKKSKSGGNEGHTDIINSEGKPKLEQTGQETDAATSKVLTKKAKNAAKRQLIKAQKLAEKQSRIPGADDATVFVGNLPVNTKRVQLVRLFKDFGPVNYIRMRSAGGGILHKHKQRKSAGSLNAYVVLNSKEKAEKAVSLNGVEFKGFHLRVTLESKKTQGHENEEAKRTVFVGNLKYSASEESLREIFSSCGEIEYVRCIRNGDAGCKGVAYVCFKTADAVGLALELNQTIYEDRPINVERYSVKKLGAKQARDAAAEKENKPKAGANQRIAHAKGKKEKSKLGNRTEITDAKKPKKSEFRGVKVEGLKNKKKPNKKKKSNDQMQLLAKKIAPKQKID